MNSNEKFTVGICLTGRDRHRLEELKRRGIINNFSEIIRTGLRSELSKFDHYFIEKELGEENANSG